MEIILNVWMISRRAHGGIPLMESMWKMLGESQLKNEESEVIKSHSANALRLD